VTRPISPRVHGILDYAAVAIFVNAPLVFGFSGTAASALYWLAGIHVLMTGITDFPYGMFKVIPFRIHGAIDGLGGLFLVVAPWVLGFAADARSRNFFLAMAILGFAIIALTDYTPTAAVPPRKPGDRRRWRGPASTS
jgi:hypothetical protein